MLVKRERHVAAAALGRMPHGYNVNGNIKENIVPYPVVEVRSSLASELIVEVFEDEDGNGQELMWL